MQHTVWAYLWDLVEDGVDQAVQQCLDIGMDAVSVAAQYHTFQQLRPRARDRRLLTGTEAAVYFQPRERHYVATCIRPNVAPLAAAGNPMAELAGACARRGLGLIAWTVCLHSTVLAARYPQCAQRTAFGDSLGWALCPGDDDVRAYVLALCEDLVANYGVQRLELETCSFGGYGHAHHHVKDGVDLGPVGRYLLGLSFSPGCMARAEARGLDAERLRRWVAAELSTCLRTGQPLPDDVPAFVTAHPDLKAYQGLREDLVTTLAHEIKKSTGVEVASILMGDRWVTGIDAARLADTVDLLEVLAYTPEPDQVRRRVNDVMPDVKSASQLVVGLQIYPPCATSKETLQQLVAAGRELGVGWLSYYNYGIAPPPCLDWLAAAVRTP